MTQCACDVGNVDAEVPTITIEVELTHDMVHGLCFVNNDGMVLTPIRVLDRAKAVNQTATRILEAAVEVGGFFKLPHGFQWRAEGEHH